MNKTKPISLIFKINLNHKDNIECKILMRLGKVVHQISSKRNIEKKSFYQI